MALARKPATLMMTATITPPSGMIGSIRNDSDERRQEYEAALRSHLALDDSLIDRIILFENSASDLASFHRIHAESGSAKQFLTVPVSTDYDSTKGKGFGEFLMIDRGIAMLRQTGAIDDMTILWKITGRLRMENLDAILAAAPIGYGLYCDMRRVPLIGTRWGGNNWMELRLFSITAGAYDRMLRGHYADDYVLERGFYREVMRHHAGGDRTIHPRFLTQPRFIGFSGWSNQSYSSPSYRAKGRIKAITRRLVPGLWL